MVAYVEQLSIEKIIQGEIKMKNIEEIKAVVAEFVTNILENKINEFEVTCEVDLLDLGMDSIEYMNLIIKLEEYFEIEFDDEITDMAAYNSINKFADYIAKVMEQDIAELQI